MSAIVQWASAHGGVVAAVLLILGVANVVLSAISQILKALGDASPGWLGKVSSALAKIVDFISANVQHK